MEGGGKNEMSNL